MSTPDHDDGDYNDGDDDYYNDGDDDYNDGDDDDDHNVDEDNYCNDDDNDDYNDGDDDDGYPANSHPPQSHQVGICRDDKGWECVTVIFPCTIQSSSSRSSLSSSMYAL